MVHTVHTAEVALLYLVHHLLEFINYPTSNDLHRYATGKQRSKYVLGSLVIKNCPLFIDADLCSELAPYCCISHRHQGAAHRGITALPHYEHSDVHHN